MVKMQYDSLEIGSTEFTPSAEMGKIHEYAISTYSVALHPSVYLQPAE
jgi:hypothetical protein